ncbi:membrane protein implicated in regulation of membrane protease activity [Haloactinopolyspora alba]|uniref:Membrane protein implicated in regulation of membrane protease activity n=1 Tax=Haloactinopolyspora alba TaxID=648780 RepID=A0A2P8DN51_9ACTN|nr:NfeD family protein [Haloactinopolyspora alba]PSK98651.1 membrane protein implicated in regulation of membrane protease activity [Haloactinopolyspora alba]
MQGFWDWLGDYAWVSWLAAAIVLGLVETLTLDLVFLMLAGGAVGGAVVALSGFGVVFQALAAIVVSVALLGFVRPVAKRHMRSSTATRTGAAALVGRKGVVVQRVDAENGLIKLAGEVWTARCYDGRSVIEAGRDVDVIEIDGATALVFPAEPS